MRPSCTSTAPTGTSPKAAPSPASASASRIKCSSLLRSIICGLFMLQIRLYHFDCCHQTRFHMVDDMAMEHPDAGIIGHQGNACGFVLAQQIGVERSEERRVGHGGG